MNQFDCSKARFDVNAGEIGYLDGGYGGGVVSAHRFDVRTPAPEDVMVITVTGSSPRS